MHKYHIMVGFHNTRQFLTLLDGFLFLVYDATHRIFLRFLQLLNAFMGSIRHLEVNLKVLELNHAKTLPTFMTAS